MPVLDALNGEQVEFAGYKQDAQRSSSDEGTDRIYMVENSILSESPETFIANNGLV